MESIQADIPLAALGLGQEIRVLGFCEVCHRSRIFCGPDRSRVREEIERSGWNLEIRANADGEDIDYWHCPVCYQKLAPVTQQRRKRAS